MTTRFFTDREIMFYVAPTFCQCLEYGWFSFLGIKTPKKWEYYYDPEKEGVVLNLFYKDK